METKLSMVVLVLCAILGLAAVTRNPMITRTPSVSLLSTQSNPDPHIIFILVDDQGYADVGYNSQGSDMWLFTPTIDELSNQGIRLTQYYAAHSCTPSRSSIMTGKFPINNGLGYRIPTTSSPYGLPLEHRTLAEYLQERGYSTQLLGKWHLGFHNANYLPTARGFDSALGVYDGGVTHWSKTVNSCSSEDDSVDSPCNDKYYDFHQDGADAEADANDYGPKVYMREARARVAAHAAEHGNSQPLFLYYAHQLVHKPMEEPDMEMVTEQQQNAAEIITELDNRRMFYQMTAALDYTIADLIDALKENGMYDNSVIVYASDNGGCSHYGGNNWPLRGEKNTLFEGGLKVPAFIHSPLLPKELEGTEYNEMFHNVDWLPTLVEGFLGGALGEEEAAGLDGLNLYDSLLGRAGAAARGEVLHNIEVAEDADTGELVMRAALRVGDNKLVIGEDTSGWFTNVALNANEVSCETDAAATYTDSVFVFNVATENTEKTNHYHTVDDATLDELYARLDFYYEHMRAPAYSDAVVGDPWGTWRANDNYLTPWIADEELEEGERAVLETRAEAR